jgi:K+-transporting ATPase A subunit
VFLILELGNSLKLNKVDMKLFLHNLAFTTKVHFYKNWHFDVYKSEMIFHVLSFKLIPG